MENQRRESNMTVIKIQSNMFDEKEIRQKFEEIQENDEVALVLLFDEISDGGKKDSRVYSEYEFYDVTRLDENDSLMITDLTEYLDSSCNINEEEFQISNFVIKCNLCNYSFLSIAQLREHDKSEDHYEHFINLKSHQLDHTGLGNCLRELIGKYKHKIKSVDINRKILIDMSSENKFILEVKLLNSIIS